MSSTTLKVSKRKIVAVAAAVAAFAAVTVSAATLGGLQTDSVGANSNTVAAPVTKGVALSWATQYDAIAKAYVVEGVTIAPIDATESIPATAKVNLTLTDAKGVVLGEYTSTDGGKDFTASNSAIPAHDVEGASVVINGGAVTAVDTDIK